MLARNSNNGVLPNNSGIARTNQNQTPKVDIKSQRTNKKTVIGVSNISLSIRSSKKSNEAAKTKAKEVSILSEPIEISKSDIGVQVDEIEIIATQCSQNFKTYDVLGNPPVIRLPSRSVIKEIEKIRRQVKEQELKAKLSETRKFEPYEAKKEVHLTNLKEFLDTGAVSRKYEEPIGDVFDQSESLPISKTTKHALDSQDRIKQKQEELLKIFNSVC